MKKILIVDDEPSIIMSLEFLMKKNGYEVLIARDGSEAIQSVEKDRPHALILDIMMPEVDGYEVCTYVKKQHPNTKVIFLSAKSNEEALKKGYEVGADDYLTKPFSTKKLVKKVNNLLTKE